MTRFCSNCRQRHPLREFDLGGGQLSMTCLGCADEQLRTEDHCARSQRNAQIATLEKHRRELIAALMNFDAEIAIQREPSTPLQTSQTQIIALEKRRREQIAALVKIDAKIADLHARPTPSRIVLVDSSDDDMGFDEAFGADPAEHARDEMS